MKARLLPLCIVFAASLGSSDLLAQEELFVIPGGKQPCPHCQGQPLLYENVTRHRCKLVTEKKPIKKTVFEVQEVPYCVPKLPSLFAFHHECGADCRECDCTRYKKVLVKKEITCGEICTVKCVVEEYVERVPKTACPHCSDSLPLLAPRLDPQK